MTRIVTQDTAERVACALALIPPRVREMLPTDHIFEGDAHFAGWTDAGGTFSSLYDGSTVRWRDSAYVAYPWSRLGPRSRRATPLVVLPSVYAGRPDVYPSVAVILHELGHALWWRLAFGRDLDWPPRTMRMRVTADPWEGDGEVDVRTAGGIVPPMLNLTHYAVGNMTEQFAEAFSIWLHPTLRERRRSASGWAMPNERFVAERLYRRSTDWRRSPWHGDLFDNRYMLALFNDLAGWPADMPPRALCGEIRWHTACAEA